MKFKKTIDNSAMRLVGRAVANGNVKFQGVGYKLHVGAVCVPLCPVAAKEIGLDLADGEGIKVVKITFEFETESDLKTES